MFGLAEKWILKKLIIRAAIIIAIIGGERGLDGDKNSFKSACRRYWDVHGFLLFA